MQISNRVSSISEALSIYINQIVYDLSRRGKDIITLSLGEAFFDIPLFDFHKLDVNKGYHYSDSQGIPQLRQKISEYYQKYYRASVDPDRELLISAGSKPLIYFAMQATVNPGEEVLIHEPAWLSYQEQLRLLDAKPAFIPFDCPVSDFEKYYNDSTRLIIINNPNNPAGRVYSREDLSLLYQQCRKRGIYVLVDEAYSDFAINNEFVSMAEIVPDKDGVIIVNSLSKNMGVSGWRVGYIITNESLIPHLLKLNQHLITCAPTILLQYLTYYFEKIINITLPQVEEVVKKRAEIAKMLDELAFKYLEGASTFYFFVNIEDFPGSSTDFAMHLLLEEGIAVVPGSAYGQSTERFVRVSIGAESLERIWQALVSMRDLIDSKNFDQTKINLMLSEIGMEPFEDVNG